MSLAGYKETPGASFLKALGGCLCLCELPRGLRFQRCCGSERAGEQEKSLLLLRVPKAKSRALDPCLALPGSPLFPGKEGSGYRGCCLAQDPPVRLHQPLEKEAHGVGRTKMTVLSALKSDRLPSELWLCRFLAGRPLRAPLSLDVLICKVDLLLANWHALLIAS